MPSDNINVPDLSLIGVGLNPRLHITPEARKYMAQCRIVFHLTAEDAFIRDFVEGETVDLGPHYRKLRSVVVYDEQAEMILAEVNRGGGVGFVTYGHPMVLVDTCQILLAHARTLGFTCKVISGVSSIDAMLERLQLDVALAGLLVIEVNKMIINRILPNTTVSCFILQIGAYGSRSLTLDRRNHPNRFVGLRDYLLQAYRPDHPALLITCAFKAGMQDIVIPITIGTLAEAGAAVHTGMSLYIPPAQPEVDNVFLARLGDEQNIFTDT